MLKIKPMKLYSMQNIQTLPDILNHSIEDRYQLMTLRICAEDLLFMTTAGREAYVTRAETKVAVSVFHTRNETWESQINAVNHVINKILLYGTGRFTYQDGVYVSAVLKKLGIQNAAQFMRQAEQIKSADEKKLRLMQLYWENGKDLYQMALERKELALPEEQEALPLQPWFLQNLVYQRLKTTELYHQIYEQLLNPAVQKSLRRQELFLTELAAHSDSIVLSEVKRKLDFLNWQPKEQYNPYEIPENLPEDLKKDKLLSRMASAVLLNLAEKVYYGRLAELKQGKRFWLDLGQAIHHSAETTLDRFRFNYVQAGIGQNDRNALEKQIMEYDNEISEITGFARILSNQYPLEPEQKDSYEGAPEQLDEKVEEWFQEKGGRLPEKEEIKSFLKKWNIKKAALWEAFDRLKTEEYQAALQKAESALSAGQNHKTAFEKLRLIKTAGAVLETAGEEERVQKENREREESVRKLFAEMDAELHQESIQNPERLFTETEKKQEEDLSGQEPSVEEWRNFRQQLDLADQRNKEIYQKKRNKKEIMNQAPVFPDFGLDVVPVFHSSDRQKPPLALVYQENGQREPEELFVRQSSQSIVKKDEITKQVLQKEEIAEKQIGEIKKDIWNQSKREIKELIHQNMQIQMNGMADKVYSRLEKRLQNERKRRGY